jgi:hypothetical protein
MQPGGPCVTATLASGAPPAPGGGSIQAGTYDLVSRTVYPGPDAGASNDEPRRETVVLTGGGTSATVEMAQMSGSMLERQSGMISASGTQLTFTQTCPPPVDGGDNGGTVGFDATGTSFTIHDTGDNGEIRIDVYMKR